LKYCSWLLLLFVACAHAAGSGGTNAPDQRDKPVVLLISIDGFRWDYQASYATPALDRVALSGVRAERMLPVFPTLTFPNHYSIATGLYPARHRLIGNRFPNRDRSRFYDLADRESVQDGSWYGGEPVWVAAERAGMVTAAYYFVGTEAAIDGVGMSYWHAFDASVPGIDRVSQALEWLAMPDSKRPHLITLYFEDVDVATHRFGPGSAESIAAIEKVDGYLGQLLAGIKRLPYAEDVYIVVVSDHGQSSYVPDTPPFIIDDAVSLDGLIAVDHGSAAFIYLPASDWRLAESIRDAINEAWLHGKAILRRDAPAAWRASEAAGFADIIVQADPGFAVFSSRQAASHISESDHGWAPEFPDMHGIFLATGARLPEGQVIPAIRAVDVYPLLMAILGLEIDKPIDGDVELLPGLLRR
jgi:predicted AlkP superfamily pyrophosphatase or phosphodiesterase